MITEPTLDQRAVQAALKNLYDIDVDTLRFLSPGGECSWGYVVEGAQDHYFLKLSQPRVCGDTVTERGLMAADALAEEIGRSQIVTALRAKSGHFLNGIEGYQAVLTPFVEGAAAQEAGLTSDQRRRLGELVGRIHLYVPDMTLRPPHETLARHQVRDWRALLAAVDNPPRSWSAAQQQMADLLQTIRAEAEQLIAAYESLERAVAADSRIPLLFCHGDPSLGNVIITPDGEIVLIDWDGPVWAPQERDLFHLKDDAEVLAGYRSVTGPLALDERLLTLYGYVWDIGEIVDYGYRTLLTVQSEAQYAHDLRELTAHLHGIGFVNQT